MRLTGAAVVPAAAGMFADRLRACCLSRLLRWWPVAASMRAVGLAPFVGRA